MPKAPVSVTLDRVNLLWLRARAVGQKRRSLSEALDEIVTAARTGSLRVGPVRSVVGLIDIARDPNLEAADAHIRASFDASLARPLIGRDEPERYQRGEAIKEPRRGTRRRRG